MPPVTAKLERTAAAMLFAAAVVVYLPQVGHGFVKDDFVWIARSSVTSWSGIVSAFGAPTGFFRPAVSLLFGANKVVCGLDARCYGITNFALLAGCAVGVGLLAHALLRSAGAAVAAAGIWLFNWHGINMAVLWISGRTSLALVLFATLGAAAFVRRRSLVAAPLVFAAMLAKEEAVLLPPILFAWLLLDARGQRAAGAGAPPLSDYFGLALLELAYFALRARSGAFTASSAPDYYQLRFALPRLASNVFQYIDRSITCSAVVLLVFWLVARPRASALGGDARRAVAAGALWWIGGFAITMFLPTRSSLYAVFPSVGSAIAAAAVLDDRWPAVERGRQLRVLVIGMAAPFLLWPVYAARSRPAVREAELSAATLTAIQRAASEPEAARGIVLLDDRAARPSFDSAFGTLAQEAVDLVVKPPVKVWIDPPPTDAARAGLTARPRAGIALALRDGQVVR